jgi:ribonuclease HI
LETSGGGWVKLNTDGSCRNGGVIGCEGILKGSDGERLGEFSKFFVKGSAYVAKLWGVLQGLGLTKHLNFRVVKLHVDFVVVVKAISAT